MLSHHHATDNEQLLCDSVRLMYPGKYSSMESGLFLVFTYERTNVSQCALSKLWKTIFFIECLKHSANLKNTRRRRLGELYISNSFFAEYFLSATKQRLCRVSLGTRQRNVAVTAPGDVDGACAECPPSDTRQRLTLCRVSTALSTNKLLVSPFTSFFAKRIR
jgi:hypothetical protein